MERKNTTKIDSCFKPIVSSSNIAENANAPEEIAAKVISDEIIDMFDVGTYSCVVSLERLLFSLHPSCPNPSSAPDCLY